MVANNGGRWIKRGGLLERFCGRGKIAVPRGGGGISEEIVERCLFGNWQIGPGHGRERRAILQVHGHRADQHAHTARDSAVHNRIQFFRKLS